MSDTSSKSLPQDAPQLTPGEVRGHAGENKLSGYLPTLDGWRCVAIGLVIVYHGADSIAESWGARAGTLIGPLARRGMWGVDLFFAISGLLITARLLEEHRATGTISLKKFYIRRACRIFPPVLLFLGVVSILAATGFFNVALQSILAALFFYANYLYEPSWYVGHFWSLAVEEHFYFLWPALLLFTGIARGLRTALVVSILVAIWRGVWVFTGPGHNRVFSDLAHTDVRLDQILWGCIFAMLYYNPPTRQWLKPMLTPIGRGVVGLVVIVALAIPARNSLMAQILMFVRIVSMPALLLAMATDATGFIGRLLESRPLRWMGRISYSLYLWQQLFFVWDKVQDRRYVPMQVWPWNLLFAIVVAATSYYLIEKPFIRLGHRLAKPVTPGRSDVGAGPVK